MAHLKLTHYHLPPVVDVHHHQAHRPRLPVAATQRRAGEVELGEVESELLGWVIRPLHQRQLSSELLGPERPFLLPRLQLGHPFGRGRSRGVPKLPHTALGRAGGAQPGPAVGGTLIPPIRDLRSELGRSLVTK